MSQYAPAKSIDSSPIIRIIKLGSCPTLSGKGQLEYHIGHEVDGDIFFRMTLNSGGGYFSSEWVSFKVVQDALEKAPKPLTSFALSMLFRGKSVNTPSFLFAALLAEGLVQRDEENPRVYVCCEPTAFLDGINTLIDAGTDIKVAEKITGKGVVKSKAKADVPVVSPSSKGRPKKAKSGPDKLQI
jgi:hypothetical protein